MHVREQLEQTLGIEQGPTDRTVAGTTKSPTVTSSLCAFFDHFDRKKN